MIRAYHPQDLATVLSIWLQGNLDAHPFVPVDYWRKNYALTAQLLPQAEVYVAEVHGQVVSGRGACERLLPGSRGGMGERLRGISLPFPYPQQ